MSICIKCGKENEKILCNKCKKTVNIEEICNDIIIYNFDEGDNPIFELVANQKGNLIEFRNLVFDITEDIESPKKELLRIKALTCNWKYWSIRNDKKEEFYKNASICIGSEKVSKEQKNSILCILFYSKLRDYNYEEAEKIANLLVNQDNLDKRIYYSLGEYYIKTRRYDLAKHYIEKRKERIDDTDDNEIEKIIQNKLVEIEKRQNGEIKEYIPASKENKEKYIAFMKSINLDINLQENNKSKKITRTVAEKNKISDEEYPELKENEIKDDNFNTFVAFDLETTGFSKIDEITEIGAIRVVNGKIDESEKFIFQELVHPDKKRVSKEIETVTGITNDMLKDKEKIWDVFPRFMEFVKDDILVGYNCMTFDRRFLRRAGRYSNIIIKNKIYDVMTNLKKFDMEKMQLTEISKKLKVENPIAHRALADAITTAKIFMKLKELHVSIEEKTSNNEKISRIKITGGRNQQTDTNKEIWDNLIEDCNNEEEKIILEISKRCKEIEKPIYNATVEILNSKEKFTVNELWENSKIMLFLTDNIKEFEKAIKTGWNCYILNDKFNVKEFLERIKI